jgi:ubiquinone/menaquinone biosynthesis C-methylase UbiE
MDTKKAYDLWSKQYDNIDNKTRDLEAGALQKTLANIQFDTCLEIGCGTGKNTEWLMTRAKQVTAVDFSEEMLARAKEKIKSDKVQFIQADITKKWAFTNVQYDLIIFSLVLEHIENLDNIFKEASKAAVPSRHVYIGELHPFKQYSGSKARFETENGVEILKCYNHNISDFTQDAKKYGFEIEDINEFFDNDDRRTVPRILTLFLTKKNS